MCQRKFRGISPPQRSGESWEPSNARPGSMIGGEAPSPGTCGLEKALQPCAGPRYRRKILVHELALYFKKAFMEVR